MLTCLAAAKHACSRPRLPCKPDGVSGGLLAFQSRLTQTELLDLTLDTCRELCRRQGTASTHFAPTPIALTPLPPPQLVWRVRAEQRASVPGCGRQRGRRAPNNSPLHDPCAQGCLLQQACLLERPATSALQLCELEAVLWALSSRELWLTLFWREREREREAPQRGVVALAGEHRCAPGTCITNNLLACCLAVLARAAEGISQHQRTSCSRPRTHFCARRTRHLGLWHLFPGSGGVD